MKKYLEIIEEVDEPEEGQPQMLRVEVSSEKDARDKYEEYKSLFKCKYKAKIHECNHTKGKNEKCINKPIILDGGLE
jgi:hypothetical protein